MSPVQTYVFIDLETTGLPKEEYNKTRITELSMIAVKREHLLDTRPGATPRVQHKLILCFNPGLMIADGCTKVTGLDNFLLEREPAFNKQVFSMIDTFLSVLSQPVCLIAQNGLNFDYPILRNHLMKLKVEFTSEVLCADCYHGFYHILEKMKKNNEKIMSPKSDVEVTPINGSTISSTTSNDAVLPIASSNETLISPTKSNLDEIDFQSSNLSMQAVNETTPKANRTLKAPKIVKAKRRLAFPWGDSERPSESYKLKDIYERVLNKPAVDAHRAENDCLFALEISAALSKQFVEWVDNNHKKFSEIEPMTIGVPMQ